MTNYTGKTRKCTVEGCNEKHASKGYCRSHYYRYKRYGNPSVVKQVQAKNSDGSCKIKDCKRKHHAKGYCKHHHYRWVKYGDPLYIRPTTCRIDGCEKPINARGLCQMHYRRLRVHGDTETTLVKRGTPCKIKGCENNNRRNGYCEKHYKESNLYRERHRGYSAKRRSIKARVPISDFTKEDWQETLEAFENKCAYCGSDDSIEQDHVVPITKSGSHTKTNIIPACRSCNSSKRQRLLEGWYPYQEFYKKENENRILKWMGYEVNNNKIQLKLF